MLPSPEAFGRNAAVSELHRIAHWWLDNSVDTSGGGFVGEVDFNGRPLAAANKSIILNSRILWFFSELAIFHDDTRYRATADRAFNYLTQHFDDPVNGGAFWELHADGSVANGKKQVYAQCFCIYAYCAYYRLTTNPQSLTKAQDYFALLQSTALDREHGGYIEAFSQEWRPIDDYRLGPDDLNAAKSMNTHLHLLEAYTALHRTAPSSMSADALRYAIDVFCERFIDKATGHLVLFYDREWTRVSSSISFGHDIEASWLLAEAVEALGDAALIKRVSPAVLALAFTCHDEATGNSGQIFNDFNPDDNKRREESVWWVQAEALVGFLNVYRMTGKWKYRLAADRVWQHIRDCHMDLEAGEWHWLSSADNNGGIPHYKAGFWKAPYHNGRAMMQSCRIFDALADT